MAAESRHTGVHHHRGVAGEVDQLRVLTGMPEMCSTVTVFSLSVNT